MEKTRGLRFRTGVPDYTSTPEDKHDWMKSIHGKVYEQIPDDAPKPYGPEVLHTVYVDANLCHDFITGQAITGIIHLLNQTIIDQFSKKQPLMQTATYGSEIMVARTGAEQVMEVRLTLRFLGVNIKTASYVFGDNKAVVDSSSLPRSRLHKRHVLLSFHRVREAIAAGIMYFSFIKRYLNPVDLLTKHRGYQRARVKVKAMLFWHGDT